MFILDHTSIKAVAWTIEIIILQTTILLEEPTLPTGKSGMRLRKLLCGYDYARRLWSDEKCTKGITRNSLH